MRSSDAGGATPRTYGIWGFVGVFALMSVVGVGLLLFGGGSDSATRIVPTPQTLPEGAGESAAGGAGSSSTTSTAAAASGADSANDPGDDSSDDSSDDAPMTDTSDLPDGVAQVMRDEGITAYLFQVPPGVDAEATTPQVAPMQVRVAPDGRSATVTVACAASSQEFLAQVAIASGETSVTFTAVALVPQGAAVSAPCDPAAAPRTIELVLDEPVGDRAVVVVPAGTGVPSLSSG